MPSWRCIEVRRRIQITDRRSNAVTIHDKIVCAHAALSSVSAWKRSGFPSSPSDSRLVNSVAVFSHDIQPIRGWRHIQPGTTVRRKLTIHVNVTRWRRKIADGAGSSQGQVWEGTADPLPMGVRGHSPGAYPRGNVEILCSVCIIACFLDMSLLP